VRRWLLGGRLLYYSGKIGRYLIHAAGHRRDLPEGASIGRHSYGLSGASVERENGGARLDIGAFCSIAPGVRFLLGVDHPVDLPSTFPFESKLFGGPSNRDAVSKGGITIGHDVWIGRDAIILSGVSIGTGAVIGAGAVVPKDVAPYAIVVGNPAREVRRRFPEAIIARLLESQWWDLSDDVLRSLQTELYSKDIEAFLQAVERARATA
jgi:acetyltransferase-like isoleucine patch superfamily enzyme